jgi:hypothetical protein
VQPLAEGLHTRPAGDVERELLATYQVDVLPLERVPAHAARQVRVRRRRRFRIAREGEVAAFARAVVLWLLVVAVIGGAGRSVTEGPLGPRLLRPSHAALAADPAFDMHRDRQTWSARESAHPPRFEVLCGRGTRRMIVLAGCGAPSVAWMSTGVVRGAPAVHCPGPAIPAPSSDGRTRCWERLASSS